MTILKSNLKLDEYLNTGINKLVKVAMRATLQNQKESIFLARYSFSAMKANSIRNTYGQMGKHIPPFLIAGITDRTYFSSNQTSDGETILESDEKAHRELSKEEWRKVFKEASDLGIGLISLTGKEPLVRRDVIEEAALHRSIIFPILTKGNFLLDYLDLLDNNRNLVPILLADEEEKQKVQYKEPANEKKKENNREKESRISLDGQMEALQKRQIYFGVAITVKHGDVKKVTDKEYLEAFQKKGCGVIVYLEYVPYREETKIFAPDAEERLWFQKRVNELREEKNSMIYLSLPGDEKKYGGCLAAGRGFFYLTPEGKAEPCPYSPYSDVSVRDYSQMEILDSLLFKRLWDHQGLMVNHKGACIVFEQEQAERKLLDSQRYKSR